MIILGHCVYFKIRKNECSEFVYILKAKFDNEEDAIFYSDNKNKLLKTINQEYFYIYE